MTLDERIAAAAAEYRVSECMLIGLIDGPSQSLTIRPAGFLSHHGLISDEGLSELMRCARRREDHQILLPLLRTWTVIFAVWAWVYEGKGLARYPRRGGWYDAHTVARYRDNHSRELADRPDYRHTMRCRLEALLDLYQQLHPEGRACGCAAQLAWAWAIDDERASDGQRRIA